MIARLHSLFWFAAWLAIIDVSDPTNGNGSSVTKFAWAIKGVANLWVSKNAGIKIQLNLNSVSQVVGGGLYFGTGGVGTGLTSYSSVYQF